jgi:ABC-2 type transport system permease protein
MAMFGRIIPVIRKEFIHIFRDPRTLAVMFVTPLMQLILLGYAATTDVRNVPLAVYDQDRSGASRALVEAFVASGQFAVVRYVPSEDELAMLVDAGQARAGLIVPPGYAADLARNQAQVVFVLDGSDPSVASSSLAGARLIGQAASTEVLQRSVARRGQSAGISQPLEVRTRVWYNPDMRSAVFMIPGLIGLVLQLQATLLTSSAIVRERERGTIEQLIVTPIRPHELIIGKILPYALVALLILAEVLLLGTFWFGVPIKGSLLLLLAISCLFLISTLGIGLLISTVANTQQEAFLLTFLTLLPSVFLSGFIYPIAAMPFGLQLVSGVVPLTYFLVVVRGVVIKGVDLPVLMPQVIALAVFGAALITLASLRFRKRLD